MSDASMSLYQAFADVPDPRNKSGKRFELQAILTMVTVAMLSGCRSLFAVAQFGRERGAEFATALGFSRGKTPACTTLHYLFTDLDHAEFESAIARWVRTNAKDLGWTQIEIDGKTLRGSTHEQLPGVHMLAGYAHEIQAVLHQIPVDAKTNEHKAALELLKLIPVKDKIITGDAMFCQRDLSKKIIEKQGHYIWPVKQNQPDMLTAIKDAFDDADTSPSPASAG
jgi:predicted transposase YbfD/YdcC